MSFLLFYIFVAVAHLKVWGRHVCSGMVGSDAARKFSNLTF